MDRSRHYALLATSVAAALVVFGLGLLLTPDPSGSGTHEQLGLLPCYSQEWFGLQCPFCGVTTAVVHFGRGGFGAAILTSPFGFALSLAAIVFAVVGIIVHVRGGDLAQSARRLPNELWWGAGFVVVVSWVYRLVRY